MSELHIQLIAAGSFIFGAAFQLTGFLAEQSWKTYPSLSLSYSVHPYFLYGAFTIQLGLQLWWLLKPSPRIRLLGNDSDSQGGCLLDVEGAGFKERRNYSLFAFNDRISYIPVFVFVNNCFILWMIAFQCKLLVPAIIILSASACMQYFSILVTESQAHLVSGDRLTAVIAKLNTTYTILLLIKTTAACQEWYTPSVVQVVNCGAVFTFLVVATGLDPIFGISIIYVLAALYHGSAVNPLWRNTFYWTAAVIATIITIDRLLHNFHGDDDNEEQDLGLVVENSYCFSPIHIPEYLAGVMELPAPKLPLLYTDNVNTTSSHHEEKRNQESNVNSLPRFMRDVPIRGSGQAIGDESCVIPDYFSYAFHV